MRRSSFNFVTALALSAIATLPAARVLAQENLAVGLNETKPAEVRIVSREFRFSPAMVWVAAGRAVTLVLDNSGGETEHDLFLPALGFACKQRLAK
ncbi:MAG: hypothetical protein M3178_10140 [Pseudomonadota bacterium]|nr:hypothetical protein [Pseudomonadota bacterium]